MSPARAAHQTVSISAPYASACTASSAAKVRCRRTSGAAEPTILVTVGLLAAAFAIAFRLPRHARHQIVSNAIS